MIIKHQIESNMEFLNAHGEEVPLSPLSPSENLKMQVSGFSDLVNQETSVTSQQDDYQIQLVSDDESY